MTLSTEGVTTQTLSLPEEFILMLLNEESGYFHQGTRLGPELHCRRRRTRGTFPAGPHRHGCRRRLHRGASWSTLTVLQTRTGVPHRNAAGTYARWRGTH